MYMMDILMLSYAYVHDYVMNSYILCLYAHDGCKWFLVDEYEVILYVMMYEGFYLLCYVCVTK